MIFRFTFLKPIAVVAVIGCFAGCETISSTAQFYRPTTSQIFSPKPKDYQMPILNAPPKRPYQVIGDLCFSTGHGYNFLKKSVEYNARRVGADAVILVEESSSSHRYTYYVPGYTTYAPQTTYTNLNSNFYGYGGNGFANGTAVSTSYVPQQHPGYTGVGVATRFKIDARMIRFK